VEVFPLPKFQLQVVGFPDDKSLNETVSGLHPVVTLDEKLATTAA
jgi:hypothetical protein